MERLGRYELTRELGRGGMGAVFEATLVGPGGFRKPVAVKVLTRGRGALRREARIGGLLRHRNLVDVFEVDEVDGQWFAAMELCSGGALSSRLPLPRRAVVEVGLAVCDALQYAHDELGLVHLDVKPDNLLLAADGTVKVGDLGIAHAKGFEADGRVRGTPGYMAPEHVRGDPVDTRADVYALGVTLVELATGRRPTASGTMDLALDPREDASTLDPSEWVVAEALLEPGEIPSWLAPVVERCLEQLPDHRWPTMDAVAEALRALDVEGESLREYLDLDGAAEAPDRLGTNLVREADDFVGRQARLAELEARFERPGLVVLKGPAGIGKSRLVATVARRWHARTGRQAWWCDTSQERTVDGLLYAVGRALDVPLGRGGTQANTAQLGHAIAGRGPMLLVLDGFEQLGELCPVVEGWRDRAPQARIVITSRSSLDFEGADVVAVDPLSVDDSVALLIARAMERGADVADDPDLIELAQRLDGVPLAIELAAGRLGVLSVADVLDRLGLALLRRGTDDRHGTLRAALDWSWELLSGTERSALAQLSVFSGGLALEAAEQVLDLDGASAVDAVAALVDRSMVSVDGERFRLLAGVREYAGEQLEDEEEAQRRHGAWCASLRGRLGAAGSAERMRGLGLELDNLVAACRRAAARGDAAVAVETLDAAWEVLRFSGPFAAALSLSESVRACAVTTLDRARVGQVLGGVLWSLGRAEDATPILDASLQLFRELGDRGQEAILLGAIGLFHHERGRMDAARQHYDAALSVHRELGDRRSEGLVLSNLGNLHRNQGRMDEAEACYRAALAIHREVGNRRSEGVVFGNLGNLHLERGQLDEALAYYREGLALHREVGNRRAEGIVLGNLGNLSLALGRLDEARAHHRAALTVHREVGNRRAEGHVLVNLGTATLESGRVDEAEAHYRSALAVHREIGDRRSEGAVLGLLGGVHVARDEVDRARSLYEAALEVHRVVGDRRFEAWTLMQLARLEVSGGDLAAAAAHVDLGEPLLRDVRAPGLLAELLAVRAEVHHLSGDPEAARAALTEAEATVPPGHRDPEEAIARVREMLAG